MANTLKKHRNRTVPPRADLRYHIQGGIEPQQPYRGVLPLHYKKQA